MKIVLTGSLGNISKPLAEILVQEGHQVTLINQPMTQCEIQIGYLFSELIIY
ncbi:hypothetical protein [Chitinophaga vietnamensis]|uniref:hypothetical protein n=1 Tax=Chitinophaga vietnamensis TaxID=2593957 RepID=UPI001F3C7E9A|nr:hypothetical protein [Chitinophaga vietnamensis]